MQSQFIVKSSLVKHNTRRQTAKYNHKKRGEKKLGSLVHDTAPFKGDEGLNVSLSLLHILDTAFQIFLER